MGKTNFVDGNPSQGIMGTVVNAAWLNKVFSHRHTGLDEDGHAPMDFYADTGAANAYAIPLNAALPQRIAGMPIYFVAANTNTGAATLNDGFGVVNISKNFDQPLTAGDIKAGQIITVAWDGVNYQMLGAANGDQDIKDYIATKSKSENLTLMLRPSRTYGWEDIYKAGLLPIFFNQQWGGIAGGLPDFDVTKNFATGYIENDCDSTIGTNITYKNSQGFKVSKNIYVQEIWIKIFKVGNPTDNFQVSIYSDNAGIPNSVITNGTAAALSGRLITSNSDGEWYKFTFPAPPSLTAGTQYHLVLDRSGGQSADYYMWKIKSGNKRYPHGCYCSHNGTAWTAVASAAGSFMVVPASASQMLQSGGQFDSKLIFTEGSPVDQTETLSVENKHYFNHEIFTFHWTGKSFAKGKTFAEFWRGALDHDRIRLYAAAATGYYSVDVWENDGTKTTVASTTDISGTSIQNIGLTIRAKGDGADYIKLYVNGVQAASSTALTLTFDRALRDFGHGIIGGGFASAPAWTQDLDMSVLPSAAGWTFMAGGTTVPTEANSYSVNGGKLYQNKNNGGSSNSYAYYSKSALGLSNANGWSVQFKSKILFTDDASPSAKAALFVKDGTKDIRVYMHTYFVEILSGTTTVAKYQIDNKNKDVVYLMIGKGSDFYLYADGKLIVDGAGLMTVDSVDNQILFGDMYAAGSADAIWDYVKYYTTAAILPEASTGAELHEAAYWTADMSSILSLLWNSGTPVSVKEFCGMKENIAKEASKKEEFLGIISSPTTTSTTPVPVPDLACFVCGKNLTIHSSMTASNSATTNSLMITERLDGITLNKERRAFTPANINTYLTLTSAIKNKKTFCGLHNIATMWHVGGGTGVSLSTERNLIVEVK